MGHLTTHEITQVRDAIGERPVVLVGMMGAGKTAIGRRLASKLRLKFQDADAEIEKAAGQSISDMFEEHGEPYFRDGERRVIARLIGEGPQVLATGGGAVVDAETRQLISDRCVSIWIDASVDILAERVSKRSTRPLLKNKDARSTLEALLEERRDYYSAADVTVRSRDVPHEEIVQDALEALSIALLGDAAAVS